MSSFTTDSSGIYSLAGFAFQIRVFVYYMLTLKEGMQIDFEKIDDVSIKKLNHEELDEYEENFVSKVLEDSSYTAVQVKRTNITESTAEKVLLNWLLLETSDFNINKYVLFTDEKYRNKDMMFTRTAEEIFIDVKNSKKGAKALITKVKKKYKNLEDFKMAYESIQSKYEFISMKDIDLEINNKCSMHFRRAIMNKVIYENRINELFNHITVKIMESINNHKSVTFTFNDFMGLIEGISQRFTNAVTLPHYADFKRINPVDLNDTVVSNSREYKQLVPCNLTEELIKMYLIYGKYYGYYRFLNMESYNLDIIDNIETTTYENFSIVKHGLEYDTPIKRLDGTREKSNTYAASIQVAFGSAIYLTKKGTEKEKLISWEDS